MYKISQDLSEVDCVSSLLPATLSAFKMFRMHCYGENHRSMSWHMSFWSSVHYFPVLGTVFPFQKGNLSSLSLSCNSQPSVPFSSLLPPFLTLSFLSAETSSNTSLCVQVTTVPELAEKYTGLRTCSCIVKYQTLMQCWPNWTFRIAKL